MSLGFAPSFGSHMVLQERPARAALLGVADGGHAPAVRVSLSPRGTPTVVQEVAATVEAAGPRRWTWRAVLHPVEGQSGSYYSVTATSSHNATAHLHSVSFGDVWVCGGQSNMWLPLRNTFAHGQSLSDAARGKFGNVRLLDAREWDRAVPGRWLTAEAAATTMVPTSAPAPSGERTNATGPALSQFCASCYHFAEALTHEHSALGLTPPTLGLICVASGATQIQQWAPPNALSRECKHAGGGGPSLWPTHVEPLTGVRIKGWLWSQGEHNLQTNMVSGNSAGGYGYGCMLPALVRIWRRAWSAAGPNGTEPLAPFGVVTLHPRAGWFGARDFGGFRWAQTANYGSLPNAAMPNTFLAQAYDLHDPWASPQPSSGGSCLMWACCGAVNGCHHAGCGRYNREKCAAATATRGGGAACAGYCAALGTTSMFTAQMGGLHSRLKKPIGERLALAALGAVYGVGSKPTSGPTISGCLVEGDALLLSFDRRRLGSDEVVLQPYSMTPGHEGSRLQVLTDAALLCLQPMQRCRAAASAARPATCDVKEREWFCPRSLSGAALLPSAPEGKEGREGRERREAAWSDGAHVPPLDDFTPMGAQRLAAYAPPTDAGYEDAWVSLNLSRASPTQLSVDLSPLRGKRVVAVRYAWEAPIGLERLCCDEHDPQVGLSRPCEAARCPIMSSGGLPANPFLARLVNGRCKCVPPQNCDGGGAPRDGGEVRRDERREARGPSTAPPGHHDQTPRQNPISALMKSALG